MGPSILYGSIHLVHLDGAIHNHSVWGHPCNTYGKTFCIGPSIYYVGRNILYGAIHLVCLVKHSVWDHPFNTFRKHSVWGHPSIWNTVWGHPFRSIHSVCLVHLVKSFCMGGHPFNTLWKNVWNSVRGHPCVICLEKWENILYGAIHLVCMGGHPFSMFGKTFCMGPSI